MPKSFVAVALTALVFAALPAAAQTVSSLPACTRLPTSTQATWQLTGGVSHDDGVTYQRDNLSAGDAATVYLDITPLPEHVGKPATLYVRLLAGDIAEPGVRAYARSTTGNRTYYVSASGQLLQTDPLSTTPAPALIATDSLASHYKLPIFKGNLDVAQSYSLMAFYCNDGGPVVAGSTVNFTVNPQYRLKLDFPQAPQFSFAGSSLDFRGSIDTGRAYSTAVVELTGSAGGTLSSNVRNGRWQFDDVPVGTAVELVLKVDGRIADRRRFDIEREPRWSSMTGLAIDSQRQQAYVMDGALGRIIRINLASGARQVVFDNLRPLLGNAGDLSFSPASGLLFASAGVAPTVVMLDIASGQYAPLPNRSGIVGSGSNFSKLVFSTVRGKFYVADTTGETLLQLDSITGERKLLVRLPLRSNPLQGARIDGLLLDESAGLLYLASQLTGSLWSVDLTTGAVRTVYEPNTTNLDPQQAALSRVGFSALAYDSRRREFVVARGATLLAIDIATGTRRALTPDRFLPTTGPQPLPQAIPIIGTIVDIEYDPVQDCLYLIDGTYSTLQRFDLTTLRMTTITGNGIAMNFADLAGLTRGSTASSIITGSVSNAGVEEYDFERNLVRNYKPPITAIGVTKRAIALAHDVPAKRIIRLEALGIPLLGTIGGGVIGQPLTMIDVSKVPNTSLPANDPTSGLSQALAHITALVPVVDGQRQTPAASLVAARADGRQYALAAASGDFWLLDPATQLATTYRGQQASLSALAYNGADLLVTEKNSAALYVALPITSGTTPSMQLRMISGASVGSGDLFRSPAGLAVSSDGHTAYITDDTLRALVAVDLANGNRRTLSASGRGNGDLFGSPSDIVINDAAGVAYLRDGGRVFLVDLLSGDRLVLK